ncbi:hypothetical protein ACTQZS_08150 [Bilifractor sp. LCP19S3_H10]|uniref:hypothetical protein n=1 Tax=Bilifractor sp. LCP19S3_H10 TaxID=3438736 RepID=UPI003F914766
MKNYNEADKAAPAAAERKWTPVKLIARGETITAEILSAVKAQTVPNDRSGKGEDSYWKIRYFADRESAEKILKIVSRLDLRVQRIYPSVTQGEARIILYDKYIIAFADNMELFPDGAWKSTKTDEEFILALFWHPYEYAYKFGDIVRRKLFLSSDEWEDWRLLFERPSCRQMPGGSL